MAVQIKKNLGEQTFVSNRIHRIKTTVPECQWFHVSSDENPADCCSRGLHPPDL
ncbi:Integrase catalytic domain-containing protein, partial [Aphis craccivora]